MLVKSRETMSIGFTHLMIPVASFHLPLVPFSVNMLLMLTLGVAHVEMLDLHAHRYLIKHYSSHWR